MILSKKRAKSMYNFLIEKGISSSRLSLDGKGENNPVASNSNSKGRRINRRIEIKILK
jgi:outer membrane protein OmpA-like peptidoglycan-associated protein